MDEIFLKNIFTSGEAALKSLQHNVYGKYFYHLGPQRDNSLFEGFEKNKKGLEEADFILCSGFLDYHDKRLSKIAEGCLLQTIFYYMTGDAFCDSLDCRLNNAHWQKDLLYSQLKIGKLCNKHQALLDN